MTIKKATALHYEGIGAPILLAKGKGVNAESLIALGKQAGIPIHEDPYLCEYLSMLEEGTAIPEEIYRVVAELLAFIYLLEGKTPPGWEGEGIDVTL